MPWEVEYTAQFSEWWAQLAEPEQRALDFAVEHLEADGPALGRPLVDTITGSRHANMKELRPRGGNLRVLFAFDLRRMAILLLGGDKTGQWNVWYRHMIPLADDLYDEHLETLRREGLLS
ncbi:MAG: type II toxin-antitoxin system RelE/ParE family toxin [Chloroflexota bacterium]